ncbi:MAG: hypothetical protein J7L16_08070 [Deltaproteobacteria bacterium]|nr:hypothetical protein [Deltaproteobacteria bacterium]RLB80563.1 MAG: hypothetical protein DRH24_10435 [Deltaproteobacteria bacterium]
MTDNEYQDFVHYELDQEITAIGGHYIIMKEVRLPFHGRDVLYLSGCGIFDTTCCGSGGCCYAIVPGFILNWKYKQNNKGLPVTMVEPINKKEVQDEIRGLIKKRENIQQINF